MLLVPPNSSNQNPDRLRKAESRLYSPNGTGGEIRPRRILKPTKEIDVPNWPTTDASLSSDEYIDSLRKKPRSPFASILLFATVFFIAAVSYGGYKLYGGGSLAVSEGSEDVRITVAGPNEASGGDAVYFDVIVQNASPVPLLIPDLIIDFPEGTKDSETKSKLVQNTRVPLGDIEPGATVRKTIGATLFGETGEVGNIQVRVQYRSPGSGAIFEKRREYEVAISEAPVRVTVNALELVTSGQSMPLEIHISSEAPAPIDKVGLEVSLPYGYTPTNYSVQPKSGNFWDLGTIIPGEDRIIRIDGRLEGSDGDRRTFKFQIGQLATSTDEVVVPYSSKQITVSVEKPFLGIALALDGDISPAVAKPGGKTINGLLTITNNTNSIVRDLSLTAKFTGNTLDEPSVLVPYGSYLSAENLIRWDKTGSKELVSLSPGKSAVLALSFQSKSLVDSGQSRFKSPELVIDLEAIGRRVSEEGVSEEIRSEAARRIRFTSDVAVMSVRDHVSGPRPPAVNQLTKYKITWSIYNSSNELKDVTVRAQLPQQVSWSELELGGLKGFSYDSPSRTIIWSVGNVPAGTGYGYPAITTSFNLGLRPSVSQLGEHPIILGEATLTGIDTFAEARISEVGTEIKTESKRGLEEDPGMVVP